MAPSNRSIASSWRQEVTPRATIAILINARAANQHSMIGYGGLLVPHVGCSFYKSRAMVMGVLAGVALAAGATQLDR